MYPEIRGLCNTYHENIRESNIDEFAITTYIIIVFCQAPTSDFGFNDIFEWGFPVRYKGLQLLEFGL